MTEEQQMQNILNEYALIVKKKSKLSSVQRNRIASFVHLMIMKGAIKIETNENSVNSNDIQQT